jgi:hypothetical protein
MLSPGKLGAAIGTALKDYYQKDTVKLLKFGRNAEETVVESEFNEYKYLQRRIILEYIRRDQSDVDKSRFKNTWNSTITSKVRNFKLRLVYHAQSDESNNEADWKFLIAPEFAAFVDALCHTTDMLQRCYSLIVMYYNFLHGENSKQHNVSHTHIWNGENLLAVSDWCQELSRFLSDESLCDHYFEEEHRTATSETFPRAIDNGLIKASVALSGEAYVKTMLQK